MYPRRIVYWNLMTPILKAAGKGFGLLLLAYLLLVNLFQSLFHLLTGMSLTGLVWYLIGGFAGCSLLFLGYWAFESIRCFQTMGRLIRFMNESKTSVDACRNYLENHYLEDACKIFQREICKEAAKQLVSK